MSDHAAWDLLAESMTNQGLDVEAVKNNIKNHHIETPSWGYANSGTRFKAFPWSGAAQTTREKLEDAAMVHRMTGIASSVALHIPWDVPRTTTTRRCCSTRPSWASASGPSIPTYSRTTNIVWDHSAIPIPPSGNRALDHILECCEIMDKTGSDLLSLWFADGTNYAGQDSLLARKRRFEQGLEVVSKHLPADSRMLIEYKFFEPAFYSTDVRIGARPTPGSLKLGGQAQVLVDLGHHAQAVNIEQIVTFLLDEGKLGGFHFNNRKYADDDLIVGSVNPYELFLIYNELVAADRARSNTSGPGLRMWRT